MYRSIFAMTLLFTALTASPTHYLLPDQASDALYKLKQLINSAQHEIVIITPRLESKRVRKALEKSAKKGTDITLISSPGTPADSAYLAQFKNISLMQLSGLQHDTGRGELQLTLLLVDDARYCTLSMPLSEAEMSRNIAQAVCDSEEKEGEIYRQYIQTLRARARDYLQ